MELNGSKLSASESVGALALAAVTLVIAVGSPIVGVLWWRKNGRDQRYADLAPGTIPLPGQQARVGPNDPDIPIPVAFFPPPIPGTEAGLLIDGQVDAAETAARLGGDGPVAERDTVLVHRQLSIDSVQRRLLDQQPHLGGGTGRLIVGCCWHWIRWW